jgi:ferredoxin
LRPDVEGAADHPSNTIRPSHEMPYVITEDCIACKHMDCVEVCPVDCFYEGENMLVINPDECIDCGVCEPECPADAIVSDASPEGSHWLAINTKFAAVWPNINVKGEPPANAKEMEGVPDKYRNLFSEKPARRA